MVRRHFHIAPLYGGPSHQTRVSDLFGPLSELELALFIIGGGEAGSLPLTFATLAYASSRKSLGRAEYLLLRPPGRLRSLMDNALFIMMRCPPTALFRDQALLDAAVPSSRPDPQFHHRFIESNFDEILKCWLTAQRWEHLELGWFMPVPVSAGPTGCEHRSRWEGVSAGSFAASL